MYKTWLELKHRSKIVVAFGISINLHSVPALYFGILGTLRNVHVCIQRDQII